MFRSSTLVLGVEHSDVPPLETAIDEITGAGVSFLVTPVAQGYVPPLGNSAAGLMTDAFGSINREITQRRRTWSGFLVVKIDSQLDKPQVPSEGGGQGLINFVTFMQQMGVRAVMITLRTAETPDLADVFRKMINSAYPIPIWVKVAMDSKPSTNQNFRPRRGRFLNWISPMRNGLRDDAADENLKNWHSWSSLHENLNFSRHVRLVLVLPVLLPNGESLRRWLAEPIAAVVVPEYLFYRRCGMPVLSFPHQCVLIDLVTHTNAAVIIGGPSRYPLVAYADYLRRLWSRRNVPLGDKMYTHAAGWEDAVQFPLQPLEDDLDVRSYELLEIDSVKYELYEKAVKEVLRRKMSSKKLNLQVTILNQHSKVAEENKDLTAVQLNRHSNARKLIKTRPGVIRVAILGAGRGPMVSIVLNAAAAVNANVKVYAIEKNHTAVLALETRKACEWADQDVEILEQDFRLSTIYPKCDISVSELLGSWGDNEVAPECIDGARNILRDDCTYVPCRYTSYVAPICSSKIWAAAKAGQNTSFVGYDKNLETIWVCYMKNKMDLGEPKALFTFKHPAAPVVHEGVTVMERDGVPKVDHSRCTTLNWKAYMDSVLHGFAGYFKCSLLDQSCGFTTLPRIQTEGLITWFPVFIPLKKPMRLSKGCTVKATFWRYTEVARVWYEWMVEVEDGNSVVRNSGVHNVQGRSCMMNCKLPIITDRSLMTPPTSH